jgi:hypothetical protein
MNRDKLLFVLTVCSVLVSGSPASAQISETWVARYNGTGNGPDGANAIAVDRAGNIYVTGQSTGNGTYDDYATIKYSASGSPLWTASYNGPGNGYDRAASLAVDNAGNVYVTGRSRGSYGPPDTHEDYATIKYDASGNQLWVARYNGPLGGEDYAYAVAVDDSGNAYVTGMSIGSGPPASWDYATVKYDPSGNQVWAARYNGPANNSDTPYDLALGDDGSVYVSGASTGVGTVYDYATVKYDALGSQLWVARYSGTGNSSDYPYDIALDDSGNVYVTGSSYGWPTFEDYVTVKYDADGNQVWLARYDAGTAHDDWAQALALDDSGNVYVTGHSKLEGSGPAHDYATIKYGPLGNQLWVARYDGPGHGDEHAWSLVLDEESNVYVTGESPGIGTLNDYATLKYDANGNLLWEARYNGPSNGDDKASSLALDGEANLYVTGSSVGIGTSTDYATVKYRQTTIVDDADPGFFIYRGAPWPTRPYPDANAGRARYRIGGTGSNVVAWRVDTLVAPGTYNVYAWKFDHPYSSQMATNAHYVVNDRNGLSSWILIDQSTPGDAWIKLGTFQFDTSSQQGIALSDRADGYVIADAIRLTYVGPSR